MSYDVASKQNLQTSGPLIMIVDVLLRAVSFTLYFLSVIWLPQGRLWFTNEKEASLTVY